MNEQIEKIKEDLKGKLLIFESVYYDGRKKSIIRNLNVVTEETLDEAIHTEFMQRGRSLMKDDFRVDFDLVKIRRELKRDNKRLPDIQNLENSTAYSEEYIENAKRRIEENEERIDEIDKELDEKLKEFKRRVIE